MNQVTPPSGVRGSAPVSPAPKSNVAVEPGEQFYERALRRRIRSWPDVSAAGFLTVELSQYLKGTGGATAEAVMAALLRLGHDGLVANGRRLASRLDTLTVSEARDVLEACGLAAERHARAMTRACEKDPEGISEREARDHVQLLGAPSYGGDRSSCGVSSLDGRREHGRHGASHIRPREGAFARARRLDEAAHGLSSGALVCDALALHSRGAP